MLKEIKEDYNSNISVFNTDNLDPREIYNKWQK